MNDAEGKHVQDHDDLNKVFDTGAIFDATPEDLERYLCALGSLNIQSDHGYLDALHKSEIEQTEEAAKYVGYWALRIDLVGSDNVRRCCARIRETNPTEGTMHAERPEVMRALKEAMRRDLGIRKIGR
jgi:hypothetical protein